jgi:hypothetical protein
LLIKGINIPRHTEKAKALNGIEYEVNSKDISKIIIENAQFNK